MDFQKKIFDEILTSPNHNEQIVSIICSSLTSCSPKELPRINKILKDIISNSRKEVKKECYKGLPENLPSLRALIWKINFKYLPHKIQNWKATLKSYRDEYIELKNAVIMKQREEMKIFEELKDNNNKILEEKKNNEDNFDINQTLYLLAENTDKELLETINKDINRTYSTMNFFLKPIDNKIKFSPEELNDLYNLKKNCNYQDSTLVYTKGRTISDLFNKEIHSDVLERILYIYAKNNKDVGYVQGMNAILAPIYYCYSMDNTCDKDCLEADSFWSFSLLMDDIKKIFQQKNDALKGGILDKIVLLELMISKIDKDIFNKLLKNNKQDSFHFAIKWINLFFSQQMIMPDVLRLWDIIFCEEDRYYFVYLFCLAILEYKKKDILKKDYYEIMEKLQKINLTNVEEIIKIAFNIKKTHHKEIKEILYYYNDKKDKLHKNKNVNKIK